MARVILETDASMVKMAIEGDDYLLSSMQIKHLKATDFSSYVISVFEPV
jgi:hypothetical protein